MHVQERNYIANLTPHTDRLLLMSHEALGSIAIYLFKVRKEKSLTDAKRLFNLEYSRGKIYYHLNTNM